VADVNHDANLDVVTGNYVSPGISVLTGNGDGTFDPVQVVALTGAELVSIAAADFNGDAEVDVATANGGSNNVHVLLGDGLAAFSTSLTLAAGTSPRVVVAGDLNGDGQPDLVAANVLSDDVYAYLNTMPAIQGVTPYGTGTPGCTGLEQLSTSSTPAIGNASFALRCTNAPPSSIGLWLVADAADVAGFEFFGMTLHVGLATSTFLLSFNAASAPDGFAVAPLPIPNVPAFVGAKLYSQAIWVWAINVCFNFPVGLSSSNGLEITLQS